MNESNNGTTQVNWRNALLIGGGVLLLALLAFFAAPSVDFSMLAQEEATSVVEERAWPEKEGYVTVSGVVVSRTSTNAFIVLVQDSDGSSIGEALEGRRVVVYSSSHERLDDGDNVTTGDEVTFGALWVMDNVDSEGNWKLWTYTEGPGHLFIDSGFTLQVNGSSR